MPTFPELQRLTLVEGQSLNVKARLTNGAGDFIVNDVQAGRQATAVSVSVWDRTANAEVYSELLSTINAGLWSSGLWTLSALTIDDAGTTPGQGKVVGERIHIASGTGMTTSEVGGYLIGANTGAVVTITADCGATDGATDLAGYNLDIADLIPTLAQGLQTEDWSRDGTGWSYQHIIPAHYMNATTPGHGGDWIPGHVYDYEAKVTTDAAPTLGGSSALLEGPLWVRAQIQVEGLLSV